MSGREVAHRVKYGLLLRVERRQHCRGLLAPKGALRDVLLPRFRHDDWRSRLLASRHANRTRFLPGVHDPAAMRRLFESEYSAERTATLAEAARVREHRFEFFGRQFHYGDEIDWQADPVTGKRWPPLYHADVPVHGGDIGCGDVKDVWELNRQQYLIDLGKAYLLTGNAEDLAGIRRLVRSWIEGNPYATGVNWACALEPAFRAMSWLWAYHLAVDGLDEEFHLEWLQAFYDHGRFLARHMEHYSSPYNHLIGEAAALYMLALCFTEFAEAESWRSQARSVLEGRLDEQFYPDGGSVEQSPFYHHATVGFYLLAALTARAAGNELPAKIWTAIEQGMDFSLALMQPDGRTPEIGGADDGKPIRLEHLPFWDFRPYLAAGAVLFGRTDFKYAAGRLFEDALWLLGPAALRTFNELPATPPVSTSRKLEGSGYFVIRSNWSRDADYVCFDCGEQAAGMRVDAVPNSMHGHADCLSVVAWLQGCRILVDSGLYAYNCGGTWEAHFRETAAHNTARVDGRDQARHIGKMAWSHSYRATMEVCEADGAGQRAIGSHDGFARYPGGIVHRRAIWLRPERYLAILDEFEGSGDHELEINYHFAPGILKVAADNRGVFDGAAEIVWTGDVAWDADVKTGDPSPDEGWIAPSLGIRVPAPRLRLRSRTSGPKTSLLTVLAAGTGSRLAVRSDLLVAVSGVEAAELVAAPGGARHLFETDASLVVCRVSADKVLECAKLGGTFLRVHDAPLVQLAARSSMAVQGSV